MADLNPSSNSSEIPIFLGVGDIPKEELQQQNGQNDNIKYLRKFNSGQAQVYYGYDKVQKKLIVVKQYSKISNLSEELRIYQQFEKDQKYSPLKKYLSLPYNYSHLTNEIYFDAGLCSLKIYLKEIEKKIKQNSTTQEYVKIIQREVVQQMLIIFVFGCQFVFDAAKLELYHGDIKEDNIVLTQTSHQDKQLEIIDFGLSQIGDFSNVCGFTPEYLDQSKFFQSGFNSKDRRIRGELLCVAKMISNILKTLNVKFEELDGFLKERREQYNTKIFRQLYKTITDEDESVNLDNIENTLKQILPMKYIMNFNFIDSMSKEIVKLNINYGLDELFDKPNLKQLSKEFMQCYECKLYQRARKIIKMIVLDEKFRFLEQYFEEDLVIQNEFSLQSLPIFLTEETEILLQVYQLIKYRNINLNFDLCFNLMVFYIINKKILKFIVELNKEIGRIYRFYHSNKIKELNQKFLVRYYLFNIKLMMLSNCKEKINEIVWKTCNLLKIHKSIQIISYFPQTRQPKLDKEEIKIDQLFESIDKVSSILNQKEQQKLVYNELLIITFNLQIQYGKFNEKLICLLINAYLEIVLQLNKALFNQSIIDDYQSNNIIDFPKNVMNIIIVKLQDYKAKNQIMENIFNLINFYYLNKFKFNFNLYVKYQINIGLMLEKNHLEDLTIKHLNRIISIIQNQKEVEKKKKSSLNIDSVQQQYKEQLNLNDSANKLYYDILITVCEDLLGQVYMLQGEYEKAKFYLEQSLYVNEQSYRTENNIEIAINYNNLGMLYQYQCDFEKAKMNYEKSLQIRIQCYNTQIHIDVAQSYNNLGMMYYKLGDLQKAKQFIEKSLLIKIKYYGTVNRNDIAKSYNNLGLLYKEQGDLEKAIINIEKSLQIYQQCYGTENNIDVAADYNNLGMLYYDQSDFDKALINIEKSLQIWIQCYGTENNINVATSYNNLGMLQQKLGDLSKAKINVEKSLKIRLQCYETENNIDVATSYNNLGLLYKDQGDLDKAKTNLEKSLQIMIQCYGTENHIDVATSYNNLGTLQQDLCDLEKARLYLEKSLQIRIQCYGTENNLNVATSYNNLGGLYQKQGNLEKAKRNIAKALKIMIQCYGTENNIDVATIYGNLGTLCYQEGDFEKAIVYFEKSLKIRLQYYNTGDIINVATIYNNLGVMYYQQSDFDKAIINIEKSLQILIQCYGTEYNIGVAASYNILGQLYYLLGDLDKSKINLEKSQQIYVQCYGTEKNIDVAINYNNLGILCMDLSDFNNALMYFRKSIQIQIQIQSTEFHDRNTDVYSILNEMKLATYVLERMQLIKNKNKNRNIK